MLFRSHKSNKGLILSVVIGVPIAVIFVWAMLNFDTVQSLFTNDEPRMSVTETMDKNKEQPSDQQEGQGGKPSEQSSGRESEQGTDQMQNQAQNQQNAQAEQQTASGQQQQINQASGGKKYYIVAGSFKKKQNAVNFHQNLLNKGYDSEMIGERDGMHAVSYASFQNKSRAKRELQRLRNEEGVQAWLLYY